MDAAARAREIGANATRLTGSSDDYDELLLMARGKRFVLIGEASHGTHEFYRIRAEITQRLIAEEGFIAVAAEADWPDAWRINQYVMGDESIDNASDALGGFSRFPLWMWRNEEVRNFIDWMYDYNHMTDGEVTKVGFYGLDLYSLNSSMEAVIAYLDKVDPQGADQARERYGCFDAFGGNPQRYGSAAAHRLSDSCRQAVIEQLKQLQQHAHDYMSQDGAAGQDAFFSAERNAALVRDAERYYRAMFAGRPNSWNIRDTHMADTLDALAEHLEARHGQPARIVVWAHNSHIGDASATRAGADGETNIGEITRQRHPGETLLIGFTTSRGTVSAASDWDEEVELKRVNPPLNGSLEALLAQVEIPNFILNLRDNATLRKLLDREMLHRAIGVVYRPDTERGSHYYETRLPGQFDALIHLEETRALHPLDMPGAWKEAHGSFEDETYPSGL